MNKTKGYILLVMLSVLILGCSNNADQVTKKILPRCQLDVEMCKTEIAANNPMTELTACQNYAIGCSSKDSKEDCDKTDIYNKETKSFGSSDGIHDCKWE